MAREVYVADFETTTDKWVTRRHSKTGRIERLPLNARVWLYGLMNINDPTEKLEWGTSVADFMEHLKNNQGDYYFHNLKFDGSFIVSWLFNNGFEYSKKKVTNSFNTVISKDNAWYKIEIIYKRHKDRHLDKVVIYDSLKKLPFSVKKIGEDFDVGVEKIKWEQEDYTKIRPIGYKPDEGEITYLSHDLKVMKRALKKQFDTGLTKMTVASDAMTDFKEGIGKKKFEYLFPQLSLAVDLDIRQAYKGGHVWVNPKTRNTEIGEGMVFDVKSLFPTMMYTKWLPVGEPVFYEGKYERDEIYPLFIQKFRCRFVLKEGKLPTVQLSSGLGRHTIAEFANDDGGEEQTLCMTSIDLKLFFDHYDVEDVEWLSGYKFTAQKGLFKRYIDKWIYMKNNYKGAVRALAKLMLNSLYGKFGSNPDITQKIPTLDENGILRLVDDEVEMGKTSYVPMATFITAYAREYTIRTANKCIERLHYIDTDSIHISGHDIPEEIKELIDFEDGKTIYPEHNPHGLGYWVFESKFRRAKFICPKRYIEEIIPEKRYVRYIGKLEKEFISRDKDKDFIFNYYNGNLNIKCSGLNEKITKKMNFSDFNVGFVTMQRLIPKQVNGGVALINGIFELKAG